MSANLEEKIKKENEQLEKSESLLEKTVKKAMNFGRKPKNPQKQTAPQASAPKETPEAKATPKEEPKKKPQSARHPSSRPAQGQKQKEGGATQPSPKKAPAKAPQPASDKKSVAKTQNSSRGRRSAPKGERKQPLRIISLGGLGEIGKNVTVYESGNDMFVVDCGLAFPEADMPGVDSVIPDFTYLIKNKDRLRGVVITHGHEDHIGALPYLLKELSVPLYGTRLTLGLVEGKLKEHGLLARAKLNVISAGDVVKMGCMSVEAIHVNHSIPDAVAFAIHTPAGVVIHTGDFKIDYNPIEGGVIDLGRFGELGKQGVLALLQDSTNAEKPGSTPSESKVGESFSTLFARGENKRIIVASFSSNIHRVQQIVDLCDKLGRKVAVSGRSMINVVTKAIELGYLHMPEGLLIDIDAIRRYPASKVTIITTGSQGEPMSALTRMAGGDHRQVQVTENDLIIISATPIPGNEKLVGRVVNELLKLGADVVYEKMYEVHVSGHACQDELKLMMNLVRPKFFIPVHGEYKHLRKHANLAISMGIPEKNVHISEIGEVMELDGVSLKTVGTVPSGQVLVDGLGVGDVGSIVLRDRKHLAEDGLIILVAAIDGNSGALISGPDIVSRGFVYVREAEDLMNETRRIAKKAIDECRAGNIREWGTIKNRLRDDVGSFLFQKTRRSPMILPIIQEIRQ
ncbi:MAG: RNase J family beta-CASP ribonuclease [Oscillospiraceae bacterium]|nr:RNase J family beta-CASP ribonuclease [Oscillospiraceae bacterium]